MKVLLINTDDSMGGAAIACLRLLAILDQTEGIEVNMLVQEKKRNHLKVKAIANTWLQKKLAFIRFALERLYFRFFEKNKQIRFAFSPANTGIDISELPLVKEADIIHLHWINFGFLSIHSLEKLFKLNKPIVWTLHDMWAFTGGCHHSGDCENYQIACGNCSQYLKNPSENDLSNQIWQRKNTIFSPIVDSIRLRSGSGITIVGCSQWLTNRAKKSSLLQGFSVKAIPNPLDINLFQAQNKITAREKLGLPIDKKLILFVAAKVSVIWKGFSYFQESLEILKSQIATEDPHNQDIELVVLGESDEETIQKLPFKAHALGRISDVNQIVSIYSAADVFVTSSIQENLPNTIMEAMACGTPAVGFEVGGIPEMIEHQMSGFLAKYKSAESLAEGIKWVLFEANHAALSKNARQKVVDNYSEKVVLEQYLEVYKSF